MTKQDQNESREVHRIRKDLIVLMMLKKLSRRKAIKGIWWMSWQQEAKKDAVKLREATGSCYTSIDP